MINILCVRLYVGAVVGAVVGIGVVYVGNGLGWDFGWRANRKFLFCM